MKKRKELEKKTYFTFLERKNLKTLYQSTSCNILDFFDIKRHLENLKACTILTYLRSPLSTRTYIWQFRLIPHDIAPEIMLS